MSPYLHGFVDVVVRFLSALLHSVTGVGDCCRFAPSCSAYARTALKEHGILRGGWYTVRRLCRCHPGGNYGYDPVPQHVRS